jgi:Peptidase S24-like
VCSDDWKKKLRQEFDQMQQKTSQINQVLAAIEKFRGEKHLSVDDFCRQLGVPAKNYRNYLNGETKKVPADLLIAAARMGMDPRILLDASLQGMLDGIDPRQESGLVRVGPRSMVVDAPAGEDYVLIPRYTEVWAEGGAAGIIPGDEQARDWIAFNRAWVQTELAGTPKDFFAIHVRGESMAPTLQPGDLIVVDKRDNAFAFEAMYVLRLGQTLVVKRVRKGPGTLELISDNAAYGKQEVRMETVQPGDLQPLGRVVWFARKL